MGMIVQWTALQDNPSYDCRRYLLKGLRLAALALSTTDGDGKMRRLCLIVAAVGTFMGMFDAVSPARAEINYPFCLGGQGDSKAALCDYSTLEQCQASASGTGGSCFNNPWASSASLATPASSAPARRHRRAHAG
jgi:hypothetical protein